MGINENFSWKYYIAQCIEGSNLTVSRNKTIDKTSPWTEMEGGWGPKVVVCLDLGKLNPVTDIVEHKKPKPGPCSFNAQRWNEYGAVKVMISASPSIKTGSEHLGGMAISYTRSHTHTLTHDVGIQRGVCWLKEFSFLLFLGQPSMQW